MHFSPVPCRRTGSRGGPFIGFLSSQRPGQEVSSFHRSICAKILEVNSSQD